MNARRPHRNGTALTAEEAAVCRGAAALSRCTSTNWCARLAMDAGKLSGILLQLELKGLVTQLPGKLFVGGAMTGRRP
ncbi:MAG: hypothetical protein MZV70_08410 [Desulfobacterales bacterium]|nr:hypothetical protein [Desulfobacterales bacterium]